MREYLIPIPWVMHDGPSSSTEVNWHHGDTLLASPLPTARLAIGEEASRRFRDLDPNVAIMHASVLSTTREDPYLLQLARPVHIAMTWPGIVRLPPYLVPPNGETT